MWVMLLVKTVKVASGSYEQQFIYRLCLSKDHFLHKIMNILIFK